MRLPIEVFMQGTIVRVDFPYDDSERSKSRPAIVYSFDNTSTGVILLKVTSKEPRSSYDYEILHYEDTGLTKRPSVVKCNCVYIILNGETLEKLGNLSRQDFNNVSVLFNQAYESGDIQYYNA